MRKYQGLDLKKDISWDEVFDAWREREIGQDWGWDSVIKDHGYDNWDDWRMSYVLRFFGNNYEQRTWKLYTISNPMTFIPNMFVGSFQGWKKYYPAGKKQARFSDLENVDTNKKVEQILENFPSETTIIGIEYQGKISLFEGTHRCAAIALAAEQGKEIQSNITIVLTSFEEHENDYFQRAITQVD